MKPPADRCVRGSGARWVHVIAALITVMAFWLSGCATWQAPAEADDSALRARAVSATVREVTLSASVLSSADSQQLFGTDINATGVQPVWVEVNNGSSQTLWLLRAGTDPNYFSPLEVAWPLHTRFARQSNARIDAYFNALDFGSLVPPGTTQSGILFANPHVGTHVFNVDLLGQQTIFPFTLFLPVPGEHDTKAARMLARIEMTDAIGYQNPDALRGAIRQLPCCTSAGDPINMVFVGSAADIGAAIVRRGYRSRSNASDARQHLFGRPPDLTVRRSGAGGPANWIRMWDAPFRYQDRPVILVQAGRPEGGRFADTDAEAQTAYSNADESRNVLVQELVYSGGLAQLGFVRGAGKVAPASQQVGEAKHRYQTDGVRAVLFFVTRPRAVSDVELLDWDGLLQQRVAEAAANNESK